MEFPWKIFNGKFSMEFYEVYKSGISILQDRQKQKRIFFYLHCGVIRVNVGSCVAGAAVCNKTALGI